VVAIALLEGVNAAVKRGNRATEVVQAVKARPQEGAAVPEVVAAEEGAPVVVEAGGEAEVDAGRDRRTSWTIALSVTSKRKDFNTVNGLRSWLRDLLR
jgi:hypothetical protein